MVFWNDDDSRWLDWLIIVILVSGRFGMLFDIRWLIVCICEWLIMWFGYSLSSIEVLGLVCLCMNIDGLVMVRCMWVDCIFCMVWMVWVSLFFRVCW